MSTHKTWSEHPFWAHCPDKERWVIAIEQGDPWDGPWERALAGLPLRSIVVPTLKEAVANMVSSRKILALGFAGLTARDPWSSIDLIVKLDIAIRTMGVRPPIWVSNADRRLAEFAYRFPRSPNGYAVESVERAEMPWKVSTFLDEALQREYAS